MATQMFNQDCMKGLKETEDGYYDIAIVDPPYGGGVTKTGYTQREDDLEVDSKNTILIHLTGGTWSKKYQLPKGGIFSNDELAPDTNSGLERRYATRRKSGY